MYFTHVVQPFQSQGAGIGLDVTFKVNIVARANVVSVESSAQPQGNLGGI